MLAGEAVSVGRGLLVTVQPPVKRAGLPWDADSASLSKMSHQDCFSNVQQQH